MTSNDSGWSTTDAPLANPNDYFEASFSAPANTTYHVWLRLRAGGDSKWNDSVWVQFSDSADTNGSATYRIGTSDALLVNLEPCNNCGVAGWGWVDKAYWTGQSPLVTFASRGTHTIRVQTREDGVQVDQIVLSPANYLTRAPGQGANDGTVLPESRDGGMASTSSASGGASPYLGSPISIPGTINAQDYDNGGEGVSYHDTTSGNNGGVYRNDGVDLEPSTDGGNDIGWIEKGEWLNYTVNVTNSGNYTVQLRVASPSGGGAMHVGFNKSNVWSTVSVPSTGAWQNWTTVNLPVTLNAGQQILTILFDAGGFNLSRIAVVSGSASGETASVASSSGPTPFGGTPWAIPGTVQAEDFDNGGEGVAYHDNSSGNSGGTYRNTDVDIESSSVGYDVGWMGASEYLNYTVNVASGGNYTAQLRVASANGASVHVGFSTSNQWKSVSIPSTGGWQNWTTVNVPVTLTGGRQLLTVMVDSGNLNLDRIIVVNGTQSSSSSSTSSPSAPSAPSGSGGGTLRMMTWNVRSGTDINGNYSLPQQVNLIASQNPDVVVLQEVSTWNEYQPNKYRDLLQSATGRTWYTVWAPAQTCETTGCIGPMILSRLPITASSNTYLGPSSAGRAQIYVGGVPVNIVTNHLGVPTSDRTNELNGLMSWARNFSAPRLVGGDFNSWWGEWWITQMENEYSDTYHDVTGQQDGGYTIGNVRFDFIFRSYDGGSHLTPTNCWVVGTSLSDHRPFVADFRVQ
jgi:endonuclease/exonuclease/phosphatase family metal-dependent hydrolase